MFIRFDKSISFEEMVILLKDKMKVRKMGEEEDGRRGRWEKRKMGEE